MSGLALGHIASRIIKSRAPGVMGADCFILVFGNGRPRIEISHSRLLRLITQLKEHRSRIRVINAKERPIFRALSRCSGGSLPERIEMNIRLSIPRTISNSERVARPIHACGD